LRFSLNTIAEDLSPLPGALAPNIPGSFYM